MKALIGDVPSEWAESSFGNVVHMMWSGIPRPRLRGGVTTEGVPVLTLRNIKDRRIVSDAATRVADAPDLARYRLAVGDVVGSRFVQSYGFAVVTEEHRGWVHNDTVLRIRPAESLSPGFLVAYLMLPAVRDWIARRVSGTAMATLSLRLLTKLPVVLPPLSDQTAIAEILDALEEKVHVHAEISRTTAELRDTLAPLLMTGGGRAP